MARQPYHSALVIFLAALTGPIALTAQAGGAGGAAVSVHIDESEPDAVLGLLRTRRDGHAPAADGWDRLFATAGYRALARREEAMGRPLTDAAFRAFVGSDSLRARPR